MRVEGACPSSSFGSRGLAQHPARGGPCRGDRGVRRRVAGPRYDPDALHLRDPSLALANQTPATLAAQDTPNLVPVLVEGSLKFSLSWFAKVAPPGQNLGGGPFHNGAAWHGLNLEISDFRVNKYLTLWSSACHAIRL